MKPAFTVSYKVSRTLEAPLAFAYAWCTDYRSDDMRMVGSRFVRNIHEKTARRVIWTVEGKNLPSGTEPVRVVWLRPPDAWHLETCGDGCEAVDYKLTPIGKGKTRLDMAYSQTFARKSEIKSIEHYVAEVNDHWEGYGRQLASDYRKSLKK